MPTRFYAYETTVEDDGVELPVAVRLRHAPLRAATREQPAEGGWELDSLDYPGELSRSVRLSLIDRAIAAAERDTEGE